jgi:hypothetical protein
MGRKAPLKTLKKNVRDQFSTVYFARTAYDFLGVLFSHSIYEK